MAPDPLDPLGRNKGIDRGELRRSLRRETTVELRKNKRDEKLQKRRNVHVEVDTSTSESSEDEEDPPSFEFLQQLVMQANASDAEVQYEAVIAIRKMSYSARHPPIQPLINCGILPILLNCLGSTNVDLQFEAVWALTNIASGTSEQTQAVAHSGAVPIFIQLLSSSNQKVCEQAVWALGNIVGDGILLRDYTVSLGIVPAINNLIRADMPTSCLRNVAWVICNLCRGKIPPDQHTLYQIIPALNAFMDHTNQDVLVDTLWAIRYLTESGNDTIEFVLRSGILPKLISLMSHPDVEIHSAALKAVGNITTGTEAQTQELLNSGVLSQFHGLLRHPKERVCKDAVWFLSNITAGTQEQIQAVIDMQLIPSVVSHLESGEFRTQKQAVYAIGNMADGGTKEQVAYLVTCGVIPHLCKLLSCKDVVVTKLILDAIYDILKVFGSPEVGSLCDIIENCGGLGSIETLLEHENPDIYDQAYLIINDYFPEDGREDTSVVPQTTNGTFQFGAPTGETPNQQYHF